MSIGTSAAIALGVAAGTAGGAAVAAHKTANAAKEGAKTTAEATTHAADLTSQGNAASLAFEQQKDREAQAQAEATQKANYDQWAARETRMNDIRNQLGMPAHDIPAYSPLITPGGGSTTPTGGGTGATTPGGGSATTPPANLTDPSAWMSLVGNDAALKAWVTSGLGSAASKPGLVDYYVGKVKGQPGANATEQAGSAAYWLNKLQSDPNGSGGAAGGPANTLSSFLPSATSMSAAPSSGRLPYYNPNGDIYTGAVGSYLPQ